jgi:hypothetical protein
MADFNEWYAQQNPDLDPRLDDFHQEARKAYEAGTASRVKTLRDHFAGQALAGLTATGASHETIMAGWSYRMADAMLKARKTTGESSDV